MSAVTRWEQIRAHALSIRLTDEDVERFGDPKVEVGKNCVQGDETDFMLKMAFELAAGTG